VLEPGVLRSEDNSVTRISVPNGARTVCLTLSLHADGTESAPQKVAYEVDIQNGALKTIGTFKSLRASKGVGHKSFVNVSIPAALLSSGNYRVILRKREQEGTAEGAGSYYFSVVSESDLKSGKQYP
jgi:hypothetical protein